MSCNPEKDQGMEYRNSTFQQLMHRVIVVDNEYSIIELASFLGKKIDTVYAYCEGEVRLHSDIIRKIIQYVGLKNPDDNRFSDHFCTPAGRISIRKVEAKPTLEDRSKDQIHLSILNGEALKEIEAAYKDGRIDKDELQRIERRLAKIREKSAELEEKIRAEALNPRKGE